MNFCTRSAATALVLVALSAGVSVSARADQAQGAAQIASLQYLVGSWSCSFQTPDGKTHTLSQTISATGYGWLHATATSGTYQQDVYVGYDARRAQFAYIAIDTGGYQLLTSDSPTLNNSTWQDAYPPGEGHGIFTEVSPSEYTIVSSWTQNGTPISTRDTCSRQ